MRSFALALALLSPAPLLAQTWNGDSALALVRRAVARRALAATDTALRDYKAQAHGFLFFLGAFGEGLSEPPRLIRADQLELEVYWKAPGLSKQRIIGWRDRAELPTDIIYHRDHLGIIQNNFGSAIRLGEGDEVRDVPHPLGSLAAAALYDFALGDTTTLSMPQRTVRVVALRVRPKNLEAPGIVGTLYLDAASADVVRMAFSFTARTYMEPDLEDVSVELDNALWEERFWLPYRQQIEIRRRGAWLDIPARGIIRSRWEIDGYVFNVGLATSWFRGEEITALPKAERDSFPWTEPLPAAIQGMGQPVGQDDLARVRAEVEQVAGRRVLQTLEGGRLGARGVSDLVHVNRVEGLALGAGAVWRSAGNHTEARGLASYGFSDREAKGFARVTQHVGGSLDIDGSGYRTVRDVSDVPVIAPLVNSFTAQEMGDDYGDYYIATGARVGLRGAWGLRAAWSAGLAREQVQSLAVHAVPAAGVYRPNPPLGGPDLDVIDLGLRRRARNRSSSLGGTDLSGDIELEGGRLDGGTTYGRASATAELVAPLGSTRALLRVQGGIATDSLPAHRSFVLGGRGTLLGDDFRIWGGTRMALIHLEWRVPVPFVSFALGAGTRTPTSLILAPYAAAGWADRQIPGMPWRPTPGTRVTIGAAAEWLGLFRFETGYSVQAKQVRFAFDVTRDLWGIL